MKPVALQNFNLVAVRVLNEAEARHQRAAAEKLLDRRRRKSAVRQSFVFHVQVRRRQRDMPVAVAKRIILLTAVVVGQLQFKIPLRASQIDQREVVKAKVVGNRHAQRATVKVQ